MVPFLQKQLHFWYRFCRSWNIFGTIFCGDSFKGRGELPLKGRVGLSEC